MTEALAAFIAASLGGGGFAIVAVALMNRDKTTAETVEIEASALSMLSPVMTGWVDRLEQRVRALEVEVEAITDELRIERARRRAYENALIEARIEVPIVKTV
jgi:hypothetical protein